MKCVVQNLYQEELAIDKIDKEIPGVPVFNIIETSEQEFRKSSGYDTKKVIVINKRGG